MRYLIAILSGLVYGLGLIAGGMTDPAKVKGFLDLAGAWNPSLALVMGGAIALGLPVFVLAGRRPRAWSGAPMQIPTGRRIDARLVGGGLLFGIGWGIGGFCPGPGIVAVGAGEPKAVLFVGAMIAGMLLFELLEKRAAAARADAEAKAAAGNGAS